MLCIGSVVHCRHTEQKLNPPKGVIWKIVCNFIAKFLAGNRGGLHPAVNGAEEKFLKVCIRKIGMEALGRGPLGLLNRIWTPRGPTDSLLPTFAKPCILGH